MKSVRDRDFGYRDFFRKFTTTGGVSVQTGVFADSRGAGEPDMAEVAFWNEFGTSVAPARSFLRSTFDENTKFYAAMMKEAMYRHLRGAKVLNAFGKVGRKMVFDIQRKISSQVPPPNAPSTIAKKGFDHPLVETGALRSAIDYRVVMK